MNLKNKILNGTFWIVLVTVVNRLLDFITKMILARILLPEDFGLIAIASLAIESIALFRDLGIGATLIYKDDDSNHSAANTAFVLLPVVAFVLAFVTYAFAPFIADFFNSPLVEPMLKIMIFTFFIQSFGIVPSQLLEKNLEFKKKVLPEIIPKLGYSITSISLGFSGFGVWSIVYGQILSSFLSIVLIWSVSSWRPTFVFNRKSSLELFAYGKHVLFATILTFLITNIDNAIIGRILGTKELGIYALAYFVSNLPATQITNLVGRIMFPVYSTLKNNSSLIKSSYLKTIKYVSMISIPTAFGIAFIASDFVFLVLGNEWKEAILPIQILSIFGLSRSIVANNGSLRNGLGKPEIAVKLNILQLFIFLLIFYPLVMYKGIIGMCLAVLISSLIVHLISFLINKLIFDIDISSIFKVISIPLINSTIMVIVLYGIRLFLKSSLVNLIFLILIGIISYSILYLHFAKNDVVELKSLLRR